MAQIATTDEIFAYTPWRGVEISPVVKWSEEEEVSHGAVALSAHLFEIAFIPFGVGGGCCMLPPRHRTPLGSICSRGEKKGGNRHCWERTLNFGLKRVPKELHREKDKPGFRVCSAAGIDSAWLLLRGESFVHCRFKTMAVRCRRRCHNYISRS